VPSQSSFSSGPTSGRDDVKERVREAIDIVDLVGSYVSLRRSGKGFAGLCPWHDDSKPSLQVNPERQTYRCWVCDVGGDVFSFVMRMERLEFREALEQLADRAGIDLPRGRGGPSADDRAVLSKTLGWAAARFRECLASAPDAAAARQYLAERGILPETLERFGVGFAPESWDWLLRQAATIGMPAAQLERSGLVVKRDDRPGHYDRFRGRVMFPIHDPLGRCIAFGGRILPGSKVEAAKYVNSPETALFSKSGTLYGLDSAREAIAASGRAVVVEGYTDCLAARQVGCGDVVAVLGTALGQRHAKLLRRYADRVVLVLDGDDAGRRRANEILGLLLAEPIDLRIARLPAGVDPCDFILAEGREAFEAVLAAAVDPLDYRMDEALASLPADAGDDAALAAVQSVLEALAAAGGRSSLESGEQRLREDRVLGRLARRFGLSRDVLRDRVRDLQSGRREATPRAADDRPGRPLPKLPAWDREVLEILVAVPEGVGLVVREVAPDDLDSDAGRVVVEAARRLEAAGRPVGLHGLLAELADPRLHSLLVAVDEESASRGPVEPRERVDHLAEALRRRSAGRVARASARALKTSRLDSQSEAELLERLVAQRRVVQGMSEPTEG
jgi:DNA primase